MKTPMTARHAALALLGVFVALLVAVHGMPVAFSSPSVSPSTITSGPATSSSFR